MNNREREISAFLDDLDRECLVWCDEIVAPGVIAPGWQICNDPYITFDVLAYYARAIFDRFDWVNEVMTHFGDFKRRAA